MDNKELISKMTKRFIALLEGVGEPANLTVQKSDYLYFRWDGQPDEREEPITLEEAKLLIEPAITKILQKDGFVVFYASTECSTLAIEDPNAFIPEEEQIHKLHMIWD